MNSESTNREFAQENTRFITACGLASIPPNKRQASKFRRKTGRAFTEARRFQREAPDQIRRWSNEANALMSDLGVAENNENEFTLTLNTFEGKILEDLFDDPSPETELDEDTLSVLPEETQDHISELRDRVRRARERVDYIRNRIETLGDQVDHHGTILRRLNS